MAVFGSRTVAVRKLESFCLHDRAMCTRRSLRLRLIVKNETACLERGLGAVADRMDRWVIRGGGRAPDFTLCSGR